MAFEKFRKKISARSRNPLVSIRRDGYIVMNGSAVESYLGPARHVHLLYDPQKKRVGVKPLRAEEADAYAARGRDIRGGKGIMVYAATFLKYYGIVAEASRAYAPAWDEQAKMLVVELDRPVE